MHIEYLHEFTMLAQAKSYTETARKLYITQSTLSKHISAIEEELDAELFSRSSSGLVLTPAGRAFYEDAITILNNYNNALSRVDALKKQRESVVRVGYLRDAALRFLQPVIKWFQDHHSEIEVQFVSLEYKRMSSALKSRLVDTVLTMDDDEALGRLCNSVVLYRDSFVVALSYQHKLSKEEEVTIEDLAGETFLLPSMEIWPSIRSFLNKNLTAEQVMNSHQMNDVDTLFHMIELNQGVAIVASHNTAAYSSRICFRPLAGIDIPSFHVSMMWLKETEGNPSIRKVLALLREALSQAKADMRS